MTSPITLGFDVPNPMSVGIGSHLTGSTGNKRQQLMAGMTKQIAAKCRTPAAAC